MFSKNKISVFYLIVFAFFVTANTSAQQLNRQVIQCSGVVVDHQTLAPIPYATVAVKGTHRGVSADYYGFFSFTAYAGERIVISCVGYKPVEVKLPDSGRSDRYSLIQSLVKDTLELAETVIYPWPSKEKFAEAFINLKIPDDNYEIARKNMALAEMRERINMGKMDAGMNYKNYIQQTTDKLYYAGQYQPNNLLNPVAWAQFLEVWKRQRNAKERQEKEKHYGDD